MRKGDAGKCLYAYIAGIQAHMDMMQAKLTAWQAAGYTATNPDMAPMDPAAINAYLDQRCSCTRLEVLPCQISCCRNILPWVAALKTGTICAALISVQVM